MTIILLLGVPGADNHSRTAGQAIKSSQEIVSLIARLSWHSIGMNCDVLGNICPQDEESRRLVRIGKPATDALLNELEDENKGVAAHIILTQIWERPNARGAMRFGEDKLLFTYNGLEWAWVFEENVYKYKIEKHALAQNAAQWRRKINRYRKRHSGVAQTFTYRRQNHA